MLDKRQLKKLVMELEASNYNKLIFYKSDGGYYKLTGNSVLIYAGHVANKSI